MPQLILFDCDGVLVDTERPQMRVMADMVQEYGGQLTAAEAMHLSRGRAMHTHLALMQARIGRPLPADFEAQLRARWAAAFEQELHPMPGAADLLQRLRLPVGVVSNGPRAKMEHTLTLTGLRGYFGPHLYSAWDIQHWKPDPALYLHAAEQMNTLPVHCWVVEDSTPGVQAAVAAGMTVIGYAPDPTHAAELTAAGATRLITHLEQLTMSKEQ